MVSQRTIESTKFVIDFFIIIFAEWVYTLIWVYLSRIIITIRIDRYDGAIRFFICFFTWHMHWNLHIHFYIFIHPFSVSLRKWTLYHWNMNVASSFGFYDERWRASILVARSVKFIECDIWIVCDITYAHNTNTNRPENYIVINRCINGMRWLI